MNITTVFVIILGFILAYILIISVFTTAFRATGLTKEKSRYQAISLFTNCGFTTGESELITSNRRRRTLATILMIIGHVFSVIIVSLVVSMFSSFDVNSIKDNYKVLIIILTSFVLIILIFNLPFISRPLSNMFERVAAKNILKKEKKNIITILDNYGKQSLVEIYLYNVPDILNDKSLIEANLKRNYNLNIVTIKRKNKVLEVSADTIIQPYDKVILFGNIIMINEIFKSNKKTKISKLFETENKIQIIDNYGKDALCEIEVHQIPDILDNKKLQDSVLKTKYDIQILMINRAGNQSLAKSDTIIKELDTITVFGPYQNIKNIFYIKEEQVLEE